MPGCAISASTASLSPLTTLKTPSGSPASFSRRASSMRHRRVLLARLQDEGVAARERDREHPQRHHRREVERRDAGHHAERLPHRVAVDAGADFFGELALEQLRNAGGELDHLDAPLHLAGGVRRDLAVFGGDDRGQARAGRARAARGSASGCAPAAAAASPPTAGTRRSRRSRPRPPRPCRRTRRGGSARRWPGCRRRRSDRSAPSTSWPPMKCGTRWKGRRRRPILNCGALGHGHGGVRLS